MTFEELYQVKDMIESDVFQKNIVKPLRAYQKEQQNNFFSDTLKDSWRKGGRVEAIQHFFKILEIIDEDYNNAKAEKK